MNMKFVTIVFMFLTVATVAFNIDRIKKKNQIKLQKKSKFKTKTKLFDWAIGENRTYKMYVYVADKNVYSECEFKGEYLYPSSSVAEDKKKGWVLESCNVKGDFENVFEKRRDGSYILDYRRCSAFTFNDVSSIWGLKGRTMITNAKTNTGGGSFEVTFMFEYKVIGNYITKGDLATLCAHTNENRKNRISEINSKKEISKLHALNYDTSNTQAKALSQPISQFDAEIEKQKQIQKNMLVEAKKQLDTCTNLSGQAKTLQAQNTKAQEDKTTELKKRNDASEQVEKFTKDIADLTKQLNDETTKRNDAETKKTNSANFATQQQLVADNLTKNKIADQTQKDKDKASALENTAKEKTKASKCSDDLKAAVPANTKDFDEAKKILNEAVFSLTNYSACFNRFYVAGY